MSGETLLQEAAATIANRRETYGEPADNLAVIARRWSITLGHPVTPAQVALCMIDVKLARLSRDPEHLDSMIDVAGYAAVLREVSR
ncbi:MAG: DUF6378 domain-containing protein [Reyranellaceae bacterium]